MVFSFAQPTTTTTNSLGSVAVIFCDELITGGGQLSCDQVTDYREGRSAGAADSVELFALPDEGQSNISFLPLGVAEGGGWTQSDVTPLARDLDSRRCQKLRTTVCFPPIARTAVASTDGKSRF